MSQPVISVEGLGKRYFIGHQARHDTLRDRLAHGARGLLQRWRDPASRSMIEEFWALRDVSFQVNQGDVVGIIGRNGAGKSTLLKILSRITEPTTGRATIRGRVASLLEVGTGFHKELTGRENIFLNGTILGMSRQEIRRRFDEIVDFSQVEKFLDTPVKRYSSGMYVRLAFAVAAHLEPEILVVDEVLAVGDASFQRKCLNKMDDASKSGRTVLFVSHKMDSLRRLCDRAILLGGGRLLDQGETEKVVAAYLASAQGRALLDDRGPAPHKPMHLRWVRLVGSDGRVSSNASRTETLVARICYDINSPVRDVHVVCHISDIEDRVVFSTGDCDVGRSIADPRMPGQYIGEFRLPTALLNEGEYRLTVALGVPYGLIHDRQAEVASFSITDTRNEGGPQYAQRRPGTFVADLPWTIRTAGASARGMDSPAP
jgi:lipopolysaccharide transport system ATP-binding protein